jgi:hypothetical protein
MSARCSAVRAAMKAARWPGSPISAIFLAYIALTEAAAAIGPMDAVGSAIDARGSKPGAHIA